MGDAQRRHTKTVSGKCGLASVVGPDLLIFCRQHFVHPSDVTVAACGHSPRRGRLSHHHRCLGGWESRQGRRGSFCRASYSRFPRSNVVCCYEKQSFCTRELSFRSAQCVKTLLNHLQGLHAHMEWSYLTYRGRFKWKYSARTGPPNIAQTPKISASRTHAKQSCADAT